jgi:methylglutaconyl-CoA hydratase
MTIMNDHVNSRIIDGIAHVEFYDPKSNALPGATLKALADTITLLGKNEDVRVIVVKSRGDRAFCAGASFDELIAIESEEAGHAFFMGFANVINAMRTCPKFIIGRVQGKAVGGGVGMASAVDFCLATSYAEVKLSELAIGIGPFVVGPAVQRKIGLSAMSELAINATEWRSAEWAKEKGLYQEIFSSSNELDQAVSALAKRLSTFNPEAMMELKKNFWSGCEHWNELLPERAAMSGKLVLSDFTKKAIAKFKQ